MRGRIRACIVESAGVRNAGTLAATVVTLLNHLLTTFRACAARDGHVVGRDDGDQDLGRTELFVAHSIEAQRHADQIEARIIQLGRRPDPATGGLVRGAAGTATGHAFIDFIKKDMLAQCIAMDSCRDVVDYLGDQDPDTRRLLEGILAGEKKHAEALADLLESLPL
ncbi:MAG: ferritin-like domain-containing protein [Betaproteobacteria bacterium]